jgi:uncharacterized protein (DUF1501 family)
MKRRDFLKICGAAGMGFAAPVRLGAAPEPQPYDGPYYVVFNASGGWDTTYLMDPKGVNKINRLYKEEEILTQGNHRLAPLAKHIGAGMSNEDFFKKYGDELLVFNGLDYSVNNPARDIWRRASSTVWLTRHLRRLWLLVEARMCRSRS